MARSAACDPAQHMDARTLHKLPRCVVDRAAYVARTTSELYPMPRPVGSLGSETRNRSRSFVERRIPMTAMRRRDLLLGAFSRARADATTPAMVATIQSFDCLARGGQICTVCSERCPVPGAVTLEGTRVRISPESCTGCGTCVDVCPAPTPAIVLWPRTTALDLKRSTR